MWSGALEGVPVCTSGAFRTATRDGGIGMGCYKNGLVITGGASGIGAATVKAALARGWPVAFCDVQARDKIDPSLLTEKSLYVEADVTKPDQISYFRVSTIRSFLERDLTPERLAAWLAAATREALLKMAIAARTLRKADAAQRVADTCIALAQIR